MACTLAAWLTVFIMQGMSLSGASFNVSSQAQFTAAGALLEGVVASDTDGVVVDYLRIYNTNPGQDDGNLALRFGGRGNWSKKRSISLTIPIDFNTAGANVGRANRIGEKCEVDLTVVGNANEDWSDLRLTDWTGNQVPFRILNYEQPVDNQDTPVRLLFEADANVNAPAASNTYTLYYGNTDALTVADETLSQFYLVNHDFEDALSGWNIATRGYNLQSAETYAGLDHINNTNAHAQYPFLAIEEGLSITPAGFVGFDSKACLSVGYPESTAYPARAWRAVSQYVTGPSTGTYILSAQRRFSSASFTQGWYSLMFMQTNAVGRDRRFFVSSGFSDWMETQVDFNPVATRTIEIGLGMFTENAGGTNYRERRCNFDWATLALKYPLIQAFGAAEDAGYLRVATYTSQEFDTGVANPNYESIVWSANTTSPGTSISFQTRTAAVSGGPYSAWSAPIVINGGAIVSPATRYIQFRAILETSRTEFSPILNEVTIFYNLPATDFRIDVPATAMAGEYFDIQLTPVDQTGATATSFVGNAILSADSPNVEFSRLNHVFTSFDNGTTFIQVRNPVAESFIITATSGVIASDSNPVQTLPAPSVALELQLWPAVVTAGSLFAGQIVAVDQYGNVDTANNGTVNIQTSDPVPASFPASVILSNGVANVASCAFYTVPSQRLTVTEANSGISTYTDVVVNAGAASRLRLSAEPDQYQDVEFNLAIAAVDDYGNLDTSINTTFNLSSSLGSIATVSGNIVAGVCTHPVTLDTEGNLTISGLTATALAGDFGLSVHPSPPPQLQRFLIDAGYDQLAGVPFTLTIEARDNAEQVLTSYDGACRIIPSVGQCSLSMTTGYKFLDGFLAIPISLSAADSNVILRVEDIKDNSKIGLLFLNVRPAGLAEFEIDTPPAADAGATFTFTIRARDNQGNLLTNYTGTVIITHTATGGDISIPAIYTFIAADAGVKTFLGATGARFTKAESIKIQAEDSGKVGVSDFVHITADETDPVIEIRPDMLSVDLGTSLSFNLFLKDRFDNPLNGYTGTIDLVYSDPTVLGPASHSFLDFENGFKRFLLAVTPANLGNFTITANDPVSGNSDTTDTISVISGATTNFTFSPLTINRVAGQSFTYAVTASNTAGNINEQYNGGIRFSTQDPLALIPQDSTLVNGAGSFGSTFFTAGNFQLTVRDINTPSITGSMNVNVVASTPSQLVIDVNVPGLTIVAGTSFSYQIRVLDSYGNPASYTGAITVSSADVKPTSTPTTIFNPVNQSVINGNWTFSTAGTQKLTVTSPAFSTVYSSPVVVNATSPFAIAGDFPTAVSSELVVPFYVRIVDQYGNPTPLFTSQITTTSTGQGFITQSYTFSANDYGQHTFFLRWDRDDNAPQNMTLTFNRNPVGSIPAPGAPLTINLLLDNPRNAAAQYPFMNSWLSRPNQQVVASQPFQMVYRALSIKDTAASITSVIDFSMSDGYCLLSRDGITYGSTLTLANESVVPFWAIVSRTGYLTMVARPRLDPRLTGSVTFVSLPGPVEKTTLQADSPQQAGVSFPLLSEWWDHHDNYARMAVGPLLFSSIASGSRAFDPDNLLVAGRDGRFSHQQNNLWLTNDFVIASDSTDIRIDRLRQQISIQGTYDEDFSSAVLNFPNWQTMDFGTSAGGFALNDSQLRIWTIGNGTLSNHLSPSSTAATAANWYEDANDSYYFLYFDWPVNDIFAFDARIFVRRMWYDNVLDYSRCHVAVMMADSSHATRPCFVSSMLRRVDNSHTSNHEIGVFLGQAVYRNTPDGRRFRRKISVQASTVTTHPKWLRLQRNAAGVFSPQLSPDGVNWQQLNQSPFNTAATDPDPNPAFAAATTRLGISVAAGSNTRAGMAWVDEFQINRYPQSATYTSIVYDTGSSSVVLTDPIRLEADFNTGNVRLYMRGSNDSATVGAQAWTELTLVWGGGTQYTAVPPVALNRRYIQYALRLDAHVAGTNGGQTFYDATPYVRSVQVGYTIGTQGATFAERNVEPPATIIASFSPTITAETQVEILGGTVASLAIDVPASVTAGVPFTISVRALDTFGNIADDYDGTWSFTTSDIDPFPGSVPGDYTVVPAADAGQHTFYNASVLFNGPTSTITVFDGTLTATSTPIIVNPGRIGAFAIFALSPQPAGTVFPLSIEALDVYNNLKTDYSGVMTFTDNRTGGTALYDPASLPAASWTAGLATLTPGVSFTKAEIINVTGQSSYRSGVSNPIEIGNAPPAALLISVSTVSPDSGIPFSVTLKALDIYGNIARNYLGTVHFSCNDAHLAVVLPADYTFIGADAGQKTFTSEFTLITPGAVNLQVVDTVNATMTHQFPLTVLPGPAKRFELSCSDIQTAGVPFNLIVKVYDDYGNLKTNFSETINLLSSFTSILPVSAGGFSNGQLLIPSVELNEAGVMPATKKIAAVFGAVSGDRDVTLWPSSAVFDRFDLETIPVEPTVGDAFKLVIKAVGPDGNVFTGYDNAGVYLTASNSAGLAVVPPMMPVEANSFTIGVKELYARNWEAGEITIWATNKGPPLPVRVGSLTVNFLPTNLSHFTVVPGTSTVEPFPNNYYQAVNGSFPVFLTAYDTIGNIKTDYTGTVQITHNGTGTLSVTTAAFVDGVATITATAYDDYGRIRLKARDSVLDRSGTSGNLYFYGPLARFDIACGYHQTDETAFLTELTAIDIYDQEKKNYNLLTDTQRLSWDLGPLTDVTLTPVPLPLTWEDAKNYVWLTVDRPAAGADIGTFTFNVRDDAEPSKTGTATVNIHKTSALSAVGLMIEAFSPQQSTKPFPMAVKAVDVNNAVVKTWSGDTTLSMVSSLGTPETIYPSAISAASFVDGTYATTTARIDVPATYTVTAVSGAFTGVFDPLYVSPGPVSELLLTVPPYAPLNTPFTISVAGLTADGNVKSDYVPEGPIQLKLNATSTGYLGVQFINPEDFSGGIATITTQTYNKSQTIWITAIENVDNLKTTAGPILVFGPPVRLVLQPQPDASANFFWNAWFQVRVNVLDVNGYPVANFSGDIDFAALPGTAPTATDPTILPGFETQYFEEDSMGSQLFFLKVLYSTPASPINLLLEAENATNSIADVTGDVKFLKESVFDTFEIVSPTSGMTVPKNRPFPVRVRAVDNFGMPYTLVASFPTLTAELLDPLHLTMFSASPTSPLSFMGTSELLLVGNIDYAESSTATVRFTLTPEDMSPAGDMVDFLIIEGYNIKNSVYQEIATTTFIDPGRYIVSGFVSPGTGSADIKLTLIDATGEPVESYGVRIASSGVCTPIGPVVSFGSSNPIHVGNNLSDHNVWYRIHAVFNYQFVPALASETILHLQNSTPDGYPASASVLFDGIQFERTKDPDQRRPTSFSPKGWQLHSPTKQRSMSGEYMYYEQ